MQHSVEAIARFDAGAQNLRVTSRRVEELVDEAWSFKRKVICFVTGVPGAGKTLVGLNIATRRQETDAAAHAVFLSGNGPLVAVLREALTRDELGRQRDRGVRIRKGTIAESVKAFIQNVHHFRDDLLSDAGAPAEHVVIFDERSEHGTCSKQRTSCSERRNAPGFLNQNRSFSSRVWTDTQIGLSSSVWWAVDRKSTSVKLASTRGLRR